MNPVEELVSNFQNLMGQVHEILQPFIVMLAGAVPFVEGEGAAIIGVVGGVNPIVAGVAGAAGNFLAVLIVVLLRFKRWADRSAGVGDMANVLAPAVVVVLAVEVVLLRTRRTGPARTPSLPRLNGRSTPSRSMTNSPLARAASPDEAHA